MTKLVIVSDIHGAIGRLKRMLEQEPDLDYLIFLGDGERDMSQIKDVVPQRKVYSVRGNCDYLGESPLEGLAAFDGVLFFYTHGHSYRVKYDLDYFTSVVQSRGADVGLFGHTHTPLVMDEEFHDLPTLFNPGSLGFGASYGVILCDKGKVSFSHRHVKGSYL